MYKESENCKKINHRTDEEKKEYSKRLNRIEGQINGINKMIEEDRHCDEILIQIAAVNRSIKSLGEEILKNHMKTCMVEDINNKKYESIDEVVDLYKRLI
jgi:DNA-binding FrmR family transcriptional regulator